MSRRHPGFPFGSLMPFALDPAVAPFGHAPQNLSADPKCSLFFAQPSAEQLYKHFARLLRASSPACAHAGRIIESTWSVFICARMPGADAVGAAPPRPGSLVSCALSYLELRQRIHSRLLLCRQH